MFNHGSDQKCVGITRHNEVITVMTPQADRIHFVLAPSLYVMLSVCIHCMHSTKLSNPVLVVCNVVLQYTYACV